MVYFLNDVFNLINIIIICLLYAPFHDIFQIFTTDLILRFSYIFDDLYKKLGKLIVLSVLVIKVKTQETYENDRHTLAHDFISH